MVPQAWIKKSMKMCGVADNISHLLFKSMDSWQAILISGNEELVRAYFMSPILYVFGLIALIHTLLKVNAGYELGKGRHKKINHLLFVDDLKLDGNSKKEAERLRNTVRIFSKDIAVEFDLRKCAYVIMKAGKLISVGGIELSSGEVIPDKVYKYLGILEANEIMHTDMKDKIQKQYNRRVRQLTSSKLNVGSKIKAISSRAVSSVRYSAGILKWTKDKLKVMDRKAGKIMTMNRMYHPHSDTDRFYIP